MRGIRNWKKLLEDSQVRCQWDPDRDVFGNRLKRQAIQLGLRGDIVKNYVNDWIVKITDITDLVSELRDMVKAKKPVEGLIPKESEYPLDERLKRVLNCKSEGDIKYLL